ncbi:hypothetical protein TVAG_110550 [Trichomonas vaginalis G3]|uniref:HEAT repeat family protein n=1 Tax=Trichomonas vaginalis (strain ATCC PRA-98 / G3) TaxID=412133 RepID=A2DGQ6_TRIV3|nr:armadillo (ARM) repeat-containing protein family [Trichomonas vaginalis G3]EAY20443.1 hypothetical protein TVAG_110550 [Trichomonas vaginalis G3]KAI5490507.1 armadillo (ARM) repeat-containing protein family [Trichomonas vaginalis G3]|eukprot:XP_001581429.1 hypothetical protein [Trichomonas vaginalis G3]
MKSLIGELWDMAKMGRLQNVDLLLGQKLQDLHTEMQKHPEEIPEDMENLFLQLITFNNRHISTINAHFIGLCIVLYYQSLKKATYWTVLPAFQEEVLKQNIPAIVIFGIFTRHLCDSFKSKLPPSITYLLQVTTEELQPYICQFFRRVIKGSGSFLKSSVQDIFGFVFRGASSTNEDLRIEAVKTLPCLMSCAQIPRKKLLPIVGLSLSSQSRALRDASAKALAKLMYLSCQDQKEEVINSDTYFNIAFKILLQFMQNEKNIPTLVISLYTFLRYFQPIEIVKRYRVFAKLALSISALNISFPSLCMMSRAIFQSVLSLTGSTAGIYLNHYLVDKLDPESLTPARSVVIIDSLINFDASSKVLAKAAKAFYPLLTSQRNDVKRLVTSFFARLGTKEPKAAQILLDSFMKWVSSNDAKPSDISGFSNGAAMLLLTSNLSEETYSKIIDVSLSWLKNVKSFDSPRIPAAFLFISSIMNKNNSFVNEEKIAQIFSFLQKYTKNFSRNSNTKQILKFVSIFILQICQKPPSNYDLLQPVIKQFTQIVIQNEQIISSPCLLAFLAYTKKSKYLWKDDQNLPTQICQILTSNFVRNFQMTDDEMDYGLDKYEYDLDQSNILYNCSLPLHMTNKIDQYADSIYSYLISPSKTFRRNQLCQEILHDFGAWPSLCNPKGRKQIIDQIYVIHPRDANSAHQKLSLLNSIFVKKVTDGIPKDCLNSLLGTNTFGVKRVIRLLAKTCAEYVSCFPNTLPVLVDFLEKPKTPSQFASLVIAELDFSQEKDDSLAIRSLLILHRLLFISPDSEGCFALYKLVKKHLIPDDFIGQTTSLIEQLIYSDCSRSPSVLYYLSNALFELKNENIEKSDENEKSDKISIDSKLISRISRCLLDYANNRNLAKLLALQIMRLLENVDDYMESLINVSKITSPLQTLINRFHFSAGIDDVPLLFMVLQQSSSKEMFNRIVKIFEKYPDVKRWTDLCKRIVIIGCVPPFERKGDIRIAPTIDVLLCAITIAEKLVHKIRETFPNNMTCVDDVVSIAFNSIRMNERLFDTICFNTMTNVIYNFSSVRNKECFLLELYTSQFVPSLKYATDGCHDSKTSSDFCLAYLTFLMESRSPFLGEATSTLTEGLSKIGYTNESIAVFCRILGRLFTLLEKKDENLTKLFDSASSTIFDEIFRQKRKISELGDEMQFVIAKFIERTKDFNTKRALVLVLLEELHKNCCAMTLNTLTTLFESVGAGKPALEFALSTLCSSELISIERKAAESQDLDNDKREDDEDIDTATFWIVPPRKMPAVARFLTAAANLIPSPVTEEFVLSWKIVLRLSLVGTLCYPALARLIMSSTVDLLNEFAAPLLIEVISRDKSEKSDAFIRLLIEKTPKETISKMFVSVVSCKQTLSRRLSVIKTMMINKAVPDEKSLQTISDVVSAAMFPDGLTFLGSLLADKRTAKYALAMLKLGCAEAISVEVNNSIMYAPRIMNFLRLAYSSIDDLQIKSKFGTAIAEIALQFVEKSAQMKERKAVVAPACALLQFVDENSAKEAFEKAEKKVVIECLTPPRHAVAIALKSFGDLRSRKSSSNAGGGWISLDVGSSSDESDNSEED